MSLDDVYRVRDGREVRDTAWSRLVDSAWRALTNAAGREEDALDLAAEELRLRGLATGVALACSAPKGGSGKTTLAHVLSERLASVLRVPVLVIEVDLEWGTALAAAPAAATRGGSLVDVLEAREEIRSAVQFAPFLVNLRGGAQLLPGPTDPELIERVGPEQMSEVLEIARRFYPIVLLDLPPGVGLGNGNPLVRWGIAEATEILAVATPRKANVEQIQRMLEFVGVKHPDKPVTLALNAVPAERDAAIDRIVRVAEAASPERFACVPYDAVLDRQIDAGTYALESLAQPTRIAVKKLTHQLAGGWCR